MLTETELCSVKPLRNARKLSDGGGLYLLMQPNGGRHWRYNYRFEGKQRTLALGIYPDVSLDNARARHKEAKRQLADGIDPSISKRALGKRAFGVARMTLRDVRHVATTLQLAVRSDPAAQLRRCRRCSWPTSIRSSSTFIKPARQFRLVRHLFSTPVTSE
jgi:Arm DNA-binding domain